MRIVGRTCTLGLGVHPTSADFYFVGCSLVASCVVCI